MSNYLKQLAGPLACVAACASGFAYAQDDCKTLVEASVKQAGTAYHGYMTRSRAGVPPVQNEFVSTVQVIWTKVGGKWQSRPRDPVKEAAEIRQTMAERQQTCRRAGNEVEGGEPAMVYFVHSDDADTDSKVWISVARGVVLRQDIDSSDKSDKSHTSIRYDYADVKAPAG